MKIQNFERVTKSNEVKKLQADAFLPPNRRIMLTLHTHIVFYFFSTLMLMLFCCIQWTDTPIHGHFLCVWLCAAHLWASANTVVKRAYTNIKNGGKNHSTSIHIVVVVVLAILALQFVVTVVLTLDMGAFTRKSLTLDKYTFLQTQKFMTPMYYSLKRLKIKWKKKDAKCLLLKFVERLVVRSVSMANRPVGATVVRHDMPEMVVVCSVRLNCTNYLPLRHHEWVMSRSHLWQQRHQHRQHIARPLVHCLGCVPLHSVADFDLHLPNSWPLSSFATAPSSVSAQRQLFRLLLTFSSMPLAIFLVLAALPLFLPLAVSLLSVAFPLLVVSPLLVASPLLISLENLLISSFVSVFPHTFVAAAAAVAVAAVDRQLPDWGNTMTVNS